MAENLNKTIGDIAQIIQSSCIQAAIEGYQNAAISGLCHEGACEASVSAIRMVDIDQLVESYLGETSDSGIFVNQ